MHRLDRGSSSDLLIRRGVRQSWITLMSSPSFLIAPFLRCRGERVDDFILEVDS